MERRDYLEIQIEQLGRVLSKLILGFLGIKNQSVSNEILEQTNSSLDECFGFDLSDLSKLKPKYSSKELLVCSKISLLKL